MDNIKINKNPFNERGEHIIDKFFQNIFQKQKKINEKNNCLHYSCPECNGTWKKNGGQMCVHHISCPCPKCNFNC